MVPTRTPLSWQKRWAFRSAAILLAFLLMELASWIALWGSRDFFLKVRHSLAERDPLKSTEEFNQEMMIHPYAGTVFQPNDKAEAVSEGNCCHVTEYGFLDQGSPIQARSPDMLIVAIMGGSVARQLGENGTAVLERELTQLPPLQGKSCRFVRMGLNGGKQPQQAMILNYLLAAGAQFDILINLDGFNEIALPNTDNVPFHVAAIFPRNWNLLTAASSSRKLKHQIGYVLQLNLDQTACARWYDASLWNYSPTALLLWKVRNEQFERSIIQQYNLLAQQSEGELSLFSSGPAEHYNSDAELYTHCVGIWSRSSLLLHQLCQANGIRYFHFLQPNQYVPNSKPLSTDEAKVAISSESAWGRSVKIAYPLLLEKGALLKEAGIEFTDLTQVFADHPEPIYQDSCCHVLPVGDEILAAAIAAKIKTAWEISPSKR